MSSVDKSFGVLARSLHELYAVSGLAFYIPPYQRRYSWGRSEIRRLVSDVCEGVTTYVQDEETITFLGSVICLRDELNEQVEPAVREHLPSQVLVIIDGQQRLTTFAILATVLHEEIDRRVKKIPSAHVAAPSAQSLAQQMQHKLKQLFICDLGFGQMQHAPKIIRAYEDTWGREPSVAVYESAVSHFLAAFIENMGNDSAFQYNARPEAAAVVEKAWTEMRRRVRRIIRGDIDDELDFPTASQLMDPRSAKRLYGIEIPDSVVAGTALTGEVDSQYQAWHELLRGLAMASYLLNRCAVALVKPNEERWAFDMFEALNTTGQQLTAFETFKPLVVRAETLADFRESQSKEYTDSVEDFLPDTGKYELRAKATNKLLIPFALLRDGTKLPTTLGMQRHWLRKSYESLGVMSEKRSFMRDMAELAGFLQDVWLYNAETQPSTRIRHLTDDTTNRTLVMCIDFLKSANHSITVSLLAAYYIQLVRAAQLAESDELDEIARDFEGVVKCVTAFFTLWRLAESTSGLDNVYRHLMATGDDHISPICDLRRHEGLPSLREVQDWFRRALEGRGIGQRSEWVRRVAARGVYQDSSRTVVRFGLLVAHHDTIRDEANPGLVKRGNDGCAPMLTLDRWLGAGTIEHIAPQNQGDSWDAALYDGDYIHTLGNLTLLPGQVNASVGDGEWAKKLLYFQWLGSTEQQDAAKLQETAEDAGLAVSERTRVLLQNAGYLPMLESLRYVPNDGWCRALVEARSTCLAGRIWDVLFPWLAGGTV